MPAGVCCSRGLHMKRISPIIFQAQNELASLIAGIRTLKKLLYRARLFVLGPALLQQKCYRPG